MSLQPLYRARTAAAAAAAVTALAVTLSACGSSTTSKTAAASASPSAATSSSSNAADTMANDHGAGLNGLPGDLRAAYVDSGQTTADSPWYAFKPKGKPPWTIAYVSTYSGNTWRNSVLQEIQSQFDQYKKLGLVKDLIVTQSNNDVGLTSQQIRQALDKGADAILTIAPSATGINPAIDAAKAKGVPVVNFTSPVTDVNAINTGVNYILAGRKQGEYVAGKVGKGGKVIYVNGIPGFAASEQMKAGALAALKGAGVDVTGTVDGLWTNAVAKAALLKTLATSPSKVDFVLQQSGMAAGAIEALQQTGRGSVPVTVADDVAGAYYWKQHPSYATSGFSEFPARSEARLAFDVAMRTLEGQGPKITSILRAPSTFGFSELGSLLPTSASANSTDWIESVPDSWYTATLPQFFAHPVDPTTYKP